MNCYIRSMQNPLISILIPFKNTEDYLADCLDSILKQTYKHWELLIVDDGSTDTSYQLVEEYSKKESRIRLYKNNGQGIIDALRTAFKHCKGDYITRMDSDDIMTPNRLEVHLKSLLQHGKRHLAVGQVQYFSQDGISEGFLNYETWLNRLTKTGSNYSEIYKECVIPSPCWMLHREDLKACGAFEPNRYPEDYDLAFRFYEHNFKCIPCHDVLLHWRDYPIRTSRTHEHYAANHFLDLKLHYFLKLNYDTSRPLVVWGAGTKGKKTAQILLEKKIPFDWICDNPKKIGKDIYTKKLKPFKFLETLKHSQSLITVANPNAQKEIRSILCSQNKVSMKDYFFFC